MFATRLLLVFGIFCICSVISERVVCDLEDSNCLTTTAGLAFGQFISGIPGVESSEPLFAKLIEGSHPDMSYKFTDVKLSGMKDCKVELVKLTARYLRYEYQIRCPLLTLEAEYEVNGEVNTLHVEGKGDAKVGYYDIQFLFHGDYASKPGAGGKTHLNVKTHEMDVQVKGKLHFELTNLYDGDKEKSDFAHKAVNDNWEPVAKAYCKETMEPLMNTFVRNANAYLDIVPSEDMFSYEK